MLDPRDMPLFNPARPPEADSREVYGHVVHLDDFTYEDWYFKRCVIFFAGRDTPRVKGCKFDRCEFTFTGSAENTLFFLRDMARGNEGGAEFVVKTLLGLTDWMEKDGLSR